MICFIRRENPGWLVEDQDLGSLEQGFQDFDTLLEADGKFAHDRIGIDVQFIFMREMGEFGPCLVECRADQRTAFGSKHHVFEDGKGFDQHEMLVHHADAVRDRIGDDLILTGCPLMRISPLSA